MVKSLLKSRYVIDGVTCPLTPAQMLGENPALEQDGFEPVVDETLDVDLSCVPLDLEKTAEYYKGIQACRRTFPFAFPGQYTRMCMAKALLDAIWKKGHFSLESLSVEAAWKWKDQGVGSLSAFYNSISACCEQLDSLYMSDSKFDFVTGSCAFDVKASNWTFPQDLSERIVRDPESWLIYIPFYPDEFALGGSLLSESLKCGFGLAPTLDDQDYFMDCYEVVRELVEDGIIISAQTVGEGGLYSALKKIRYNSFADISDIAKAYKEKNPVKILFAEVPGALIQISDDDFDYVDAELLLQDVLYFPLGHPSKSATSQLRINSQPTSGIQSILASLIRE